MREDKIHILIADDHTMFSEGLANLLSRNKDIEIQGVLKNGKELIQYFSEAAALPDIVILDINMPEVNGLDCLQYIQSNNLKLAVIVVSMLDEPMVVRRALDLGAQAFLLKNSGYDELMTAIHEILAGNTYIPGSISFAMQTDEEVLVFSKREIQILELLAKGLSSKDIAESLFISFNTVQTHRKNLLRKANENTTVGLIKFAYDRKIIT